MKEESIQANYVLPLKAVGTCYILNIIMASPHTLDYKTFHTHT